MKKARLDKEITHRELAAAQGLAYSFIREVEQGERQLDIYEYIQYCNALDVDRLSAINVLL